jgi:hypothetical protein
MPLHQMALKPPSGRRLPVAAPASRALTYRPGGGGTSDDSSSPRYGEGQKCVDGRRRPLRRQPIESHTFLPGHRKRLLRRHTRNRRHPDRRLPGHPVRTGADPDSARMCTPSAVRPRLPGWPGSMSGVSPQPSTDCRCGRGLARILFAAPVISAQPTAGIGYELDASAAVVLGGTRCPCRAGVRTLRNSLAPTP